ncbi:MAG: phosphatase PAP2 family protein, partial [Oscillospiraceae bacterium]|nr:phosphatase PAP2 family protein [Candidatus Equicaccousia limihippi]
MQWFLNFEVELIKWLQQYMNPFFEILAKLFTFLGDKLVIVAVVGFLYWCYDKELGAYVGTNLMATLVYNPMIKGVVKRPRPYMQYRDQIKCMQPLDPKADIYDVAAQGYSFPSAHTSNAAAVYGSLAVKTFKKKKWLSILFVVLILLIALSRTALGMHYAGDLLAGILLGALTVAVVSLLQKYIKNRLVIYTVITATAIPAFFFCDDKDFYSCFGIAVGFFAADLFERRFVKFKNTENVIRSIIRLVGGLAVFLAVITLIKLPFGALAEGVGTFPYLIKIVRYACGTFTAMGLYP